METKIKSVTSTSSVASEFSKSAQNYHKKAEIQNKVAEGLFASLLPWKDTLPNGPILEVGCGTGFLSEKLVNEFHNREIVLSDFSDGMLEFCENRLRNEIENLNAVQFQKIDVNELSDTEEKYSLIVSNFAPQWFNDTSIGLSKLSEMLLPGGLLLCTFPGNHSFGEWYTCCLELGLPFTANPLPDVEEVVIKLSMNPLQIDYYENDLFQEFEHSISFFKHLKEIGVSKSLTSKQLNYKQLKLLTNFWDENEKGSVRVKWHVVYLAAKKNI